MAENTVLLYELGHDSLHKAEATEIGGFKEFNILDVRDRRMEYGENVSVSRIALPDNDFLELAEREYDTQQIELALTSDINLVSLKARASISQGYRLRQQKHRNGFLKYNR